MYSFNVILGMNSYNCLRGSHISKVLNITCQAALHEGCPNEVSHILSDLSFTKTETLFCLFL